MNAAAEHMTLELADELRSNERRLVDPRSVAVRHSHLKAMGMSPAHCLAAMQSQRDDESLSRRLGSGAHAMLLGKPYAVWTGKDRRAKGYKEFATENTDRVVLTRKESTRAERMVASIQRHPIASRLLCLPGLIREQTIFWEQHGRKRRSTPDALGPLHLAELKTTKSGDPDRFRWDARRYGYCTQLVDQRAAVESATGVRVEELYIVAVENTEPYVVTVYQLSDHEIAKAERIVRGWFDRLVACEESGNWPGYSDEIVLLETPDDGLDASFVEPEPDWTTEEATTD